MNTDNHYSASVNHSDSDTAYMTSLSSAVVQRTPKHLLTMVSIITGIVLVAIIWMGWAEIDVVVRGTGKVIPARQVQLIQSLEGGIVSEILVKEGEIVETNQALLKISDVAFSSSFKENRLSYFELRARSIRLNAEANNSDFVKDEESKGIKPKLLASEESLYKSNYQQLQKTLGIYKEQVSQQESSLQEMLSKKRQLAKSLALLLKEIKIKKPLMVRKIISEIDFLNLQQRQVEIEGELEVVTISVPRVKSMVKEGRQKLEQAQLDFTNKAKRELNEVMSEISRISETQNALKDRVSRTTLRSPVKGVVQRLYVNTIGGVVSPGSEIIEIVPIEDALLVEVHINPADIAYISIGQETRLKFTAYDFAIYGSLKGLVSFVSADTVTNNEGVSYYVARVRPERSFLGHELQPMAIKVGMTTEADIITSKKTILNYLLKPINRGFDRALQEN